MKEQKIFYQIVERFSLKNNKKSKIGENWMISVKLMRLLWAPSGYASPHGVFLGPQGQHSSSTGRKWILISAAIKDADQHATPLSSNTSLLEGKLTDPCKLSRRGCRGPGRGWLVLWKRENRLDGTKNKIQKCLSSKNYCLQAIIHNSWISRIFGIIILVEGKMTTHFQFSSSGQRSTCHNTH